MSSISKDIFINSNYVIRYEHNIKDMKGVKIAGFDLDDTLTRGKDQVPLSGVVEKLLLVKDSYNIVIISNQKTRHIGDKKLLIKLEKLSIVLGVPFIIFCARGDDEFRKPNIGILNLIPEYLGKMEFFVGDAAGRPGDFSDCDKKFAENAGIPFYVSNEYFTNVQNKFDKIPRNIISHNIVPKYLIETNGIQILTLVIMIGYPGSGKSTWCKKNLPSYSYVSRDVQKDMKKCVLKCKQELQDGNNVVIDNTNYSIEMREKFISIANEECAQCVAVHINTSMNQSQTWNDTREKENRVPTIVFYKYRKNFQSPTIDEGFDEVFVIE